MKKYNIEDIQEKFNSVVDVLKNKGNDKEFFTGYNEIVRQYDRIRIHSEEGIVPEEIYLKRSPNQTDKEMEWTRDNHKQITLSVFLDYQNTRGRAWHNTNWNITYEKDDNIFKDQTFQNYVEKEVPVYGSVLNFVNNVMPVAKTKDPNGVVIVKPYDYEYVQGKDDAGNPVLMLDDKKLFNPGIFYYPCTQVVTYKEDELCIVQLDEFSLVDFGGKKQEKGYIFEAHTSDAIYRITQIGKYTEWQFSIELELTHNWGQMLSTRLMGLPKVFKNQLFYESPFIFAVDNLDLALLDNANLLASKAKCVYPLRIMMGNECDFIANNGNRCHDGKIGFEDDNGVYQNTTCPQCNGSGTNSRVTPHGEIIYHPKGLQDHGIKPNELLIYVAPDPATLEFLKKEISDYIQAARNILHLTSTESQSNGKDTTATFDAIENKALMAFIKSIADQEFDLYEWILDAIGYLRYGEKYKAPTIVRPVSFDFTTEADYLELLKFARDSGASPVVVRQILVKYITSIYFTDHNSSLAFSLLMEIDMIIEKSSEEVDMLLAQNIVSKEQVVIHNSGINIIHGLFLEDPNFFNFDLIVQKEKVYEVAKKIIKENEPNPVKDIIDAEPRGADTTETE